MIYVEGAKKISQANEGMSCANKKKDMITSNLTENITFKPTTENGSLWLTSSNLAKAS